MMDWIRKQSMAPPANSSFEPTLREIGFEELSTHNKQSDCWLALRGIYYVWKFGLTKPGFCQYAGKAGIIKVTVILCV